MNRTGVHCQTAARTYKQTYRTLRHACGRHATHQPAHAHTCTGRHTHITSALLTVSWQEQLDVLLDSLEVMSPL